MKTFYRIMIVLLCVVLLVSAMPKPAYAGTNGQQISAKFKSLDCVQKWTVTVKGYNQSNVYTTWTATQYPSFLGCEIKTTNKWWKGSVSVSAKSQLGPKYSKTVSVPKVQLSNWVVVKFP